jgi:hypothetical protein
VLRVIAALVLVLTALALAAAAWLGAFARLEVVEQELEPRRFVYRAMTGADPREVGRVTDQVNAALREAGVTPLAPLGVYYPAGSAQPNEIGWTVDETHAARLSGLDPSLLHRTLRREAAMTVRFPWRHPLSYVVGALRVIPALRAHREAHGYQDGPSYTLHAGDTILYAQPIRR